MVSAKYMLIFCINIFFTIPNVSINANMLSNALHAYEASRYMCKRWTRFPNSEVWKREMNRAISGSITNDITSWRYETARKLYNLILKSQDNKDARKVLQEVYENMLQVYTKS